MGSACCVPAREGDLSSIRTINDRFDRNMRQSPSWSFINDRLERSVGRSPSWSFRWDNRRRVAGEVEVEDSSPYQMPGGVGRDLSTEIKRSLGSNKRIVSDGGSLGESFGSPISVKSPSSEGMAANLSSRRSDTFVESKYTTMVSNVPESPNPSFPKVSLSTNLSSPSPGADTPPTSSHPLPARSTPSRRVCISPGHHLLRQISDSQIHGLKSPGDYSLSDGRASSQGGSFDGWSMRTFSELVASSQRERWSFESEALSTGFGKISGCSSRFSYSPSIDVQTCGACSKVLAESPAWRNGALTVVAVLVCGHAYHADCLESMTLEVDKYDPACPICLGGEKQLTKLSRKGSKAVAILKEKGHRISRGRVTDSCDSCDSGNHYKHTIHSGEISTVGTSTLAASSSTKPFLKRRFSFGSRWGRSLSESNTGRKKGFWSRYR